MLNKLRTNYGITLIEIMTTVVIIGIVSAMAVPRFTNAYERIQFRSANRDITSSIRLARSKSISEKSNCGVYFDWESRTAILFVKDTSNSLLDTYEPGDSVIRIDSLSTQLDYIDTDLMASAIVFRPNGSATFNGGGNIITMKYTEDMIGINVTNILASTGRVRSTSYYY
jgi:prepilin-type N-terminal cleavage/methylation domain-containing protein